MPDFREYLKKQARLGPWVKIVDTLAEAAEWIGCDPKVLRATIERYNTFCERGYDEDFAKDPANLIPLRTPPYYVVKFVPLMIESIGPVVVNENMEVLDKQDRVPIPGFFAAGVITSGWESYDYGGTPADTALSFSMTSGRIAARSAVRYLTGKQKGVEPKMALKINEYCVGCGWCIPLCKNGATKEGDEVAVVDPERCTECVGWYEEPRCVQVCWLSAYEPDPEHQETHEQLLAKWHRLHPNKTPVVT